MARQRRFSKIILSIIGVVLVLSIWARSGAPEVRVLFSPFIRLFGGSIASHVTEDVAQMQLCVQDQSAYESLQKLYADLQALVGYQEQQQQSLMTARVIGYAKDPFQRAVFIDRGSQDGITAQSPVVVREGIFVGTISRVWDHSSLVLLAGDRQSKIPAKILGREGTLGMLEGRGMLYHLTLVPRDAEVMVGDIVVTSHLGISIPPGLVIGIVSEVGESEENPFKTILVSPLASFESLSFVAVYPPLLDPSISL